MLSAVQLLKLLCSTGLMLLVFSDMKHLGFYAAVSCFVLRIYAFLVAIRILFIHDG
jgi:hypothetical protein